MDQIEKSVVTEGLSEVNDWQGESDELDSLVKNGNSAVAADMSPHGPVIRYLTYDQTAWFFSVITDPRDRALFALIYQYGLRVSEAALLRREEVDFVRNRIVIRRVKHGLGGERPLFNATARLLEAYLPFRRPTGDGLFTGRQGNLSRKRMQQLFKQYARLADLGPHVSVHSLRHSIATHLLDSGQGIEFVQDHLGHVNVQNTLIYAKLSDRRRETVFRELERGKAIVTVGVAGEGDPRLPTAVSGEKK